MHPLPRAFERAVPAGKHPAVRQWLARHPRWIFHFTPTSASWLNAAEGFFATLTKRRLKRDVFR
jgi:transposase